jgi:hypothetical protein
VPAVTKDKLVSELQQLLRTTEKRVAEVGRTGASALEAKPVQAAVTAARRAVGSPFALAAGGVNRLSGIAQRFGGRATDAAGTLVSAAGEVADRAADRVEDVAEKVAETEKAHDVHPAEPEVQPAADEFGAVGSLTDNTDVEPDGRTAPFPGYDSLTGDRVMAHVAESTDLPDLQVLLTYEEAHKNRKGVIAAVEARLAELGSPVS